MLQQQICYEINVVHGAFSCGAWYQMKIQDTSGVINVIGERGSKLSRLLLQKVVKLI